MHIVIWRGMRHTFTAPLAAIRFLARLTDQNQGVRIVDRDGARYYTPNGRR